MPVDHRRVAYFGHLGVSARITDGSLLGRVAWMQAGAVLVYSVAIPSGTRPAPGAVVEGQPTNTKMQNDLDQDTGLRTQDSGLRTQDSGLRTQDSGLRTQLDFTSWVKS